MAEPSAYRMTGDIMLPDDRRTLLRNRVSWGAIFAGIASALAIDLLLYILGVGVGASSLSVLNTAQNPSAGGFSIDASIWWVISGIIASFVGGIVAGRLCGAGSRSTAAWHGFVTWAATTLAVAYLLATVAGGLLGGTFSALGATLSGFGKTAASSISGAASGAANGAAQSGTGGDALQAQVRRLVNPNDAQSVESDIASYIRASVSGNQQAATAAQDRAVNDLARVANVSQDEAKTRIQQAAQQYQQTLDQVKQQAAKAAQAARSGVAQAGIYGFVALVIGAIAGWIGGAVGAPRRERVLAREDRFLGRDDMTPLT